MAQSRVPSTLPLDLSQLQTERTIYVCSESLLFLRGFRGAPTSVFGSDCDRRENAGPDSGRGERRRAIHARPKYFLRESYPAPGRDGVGRLSSVALVSLHTLSFHVVSRSQSESRPSASRDQGKSRAAERPPISGSAFARDQSPGNYRRCIQRPRRTSS